MGKIKNSSWGGARPGAGRKPKGAEIQNAAFEGAGWSPGRSFIYMPTVEPRHELSAYDLNTLRDRSHWFRNNFGLAARAIEGTARYTVGNGISPQARSSNRKWNQEVEARFEDKCGTSPIGFDVAQQVNFYEAQKLIIEQILTDGDFFSQLMRSSSGAGMVRFISGANVDNSRSTSVIQDEWTNGIRINRMGAPTLYRVLKDISGEDFTDVPAEDIIHLKRMHRHGFVRGVPALRHAVNHLHDMSDILAYTKGSFKLASQIAFVLESAEAGRVGLGGNLIQRSQGEGSATFDKMFPLAGHFQAKPGERITPLQNPHPGESFEPFMNYLVRDISWGIGVSPEILWAIAGIGGANTRYVLADAQTFFEELQRLLINQFCRRFWVFWVWHEIEAGRLAYPGDDWWKHDWITPSKITVDFAKDGKFLGDLMSSGRLSAERFYGMQGLDADKEEDDIMRRAAIRKKRVTEIAAEEGVELSVAECFPPPPGAAPASDVVEDDDGGGRLEEIEEIKGTLDAYGVGVRAGAITPADQDEARFRDLLGLSPINANIKDAWSEDGGVRRPITLVGKDGGLPGQSAGAGDPPEP